MNWRGKLIVVVVTRVDTTNTAARINHWLEEVIEIERME